MSNYTTFYQRVDRAIRRIEEVAEDLRQLKHCDNCDHPRNHLRNYGSSKTLEHICGSDLESLKKDMKDEAELRLGNIKDYEAAKAKHAQEWKQREAMIAEHQRKQNEQKNQL